MMFWNRKKAKEDLSSIDRALFSTFYFVEESQIDRYWYGVAQFYGQSVEVLIYGESAQIHEYQKEILLELVTRYVIIKPIIEVFINERIEKLDVKKTCYSIEKDLIISHITIFESDTKELEIVYDLPNDFSCFEVYIENFKPIALGVSA